MSSGEDIMALHHQLVSMPEYQLELRLEALNRTRYVFSENYLQLRNLLLVEKDLKKALQLWDVNNACAQNDYRLEVTRLLHNFVASVKSLVEHSRILYKDLYEKDNGFPDYHAEIIKRFAENPFARFVEDLRNYCLHYRLAPIYSNMTCSSAPNSMECSTRLDIKVLENGFNWSSMSKKYLEERKKGTDSQTSTTEQDYGLDLLPLIDEYSSLAKDFHQWLVVRQREIHKDEFKRLHDNKQKLRDLVVPDEVAMALSNIGTSRNPDEAFYRLLEPELRKELDRIPLKSPCHVEALLAMIKQQAPIGEALEKSIKNAYLKYKDS